MRIAERWFERQSFSDGVTRLLEPHVHPLLRCNIWHVRGRDRDLVIDTGLGVAPVRDALAELIDRPVTAVATHIHWDHVGGLHEFSDRLMHRLEAARMETYEEFHTIRSADFPAEIVEALSELGYPIETELLIDALPHEGYDPASYAITPTLPNIVVEEGEAVDLGDRRFEVWHLPGHSPGSIGLWEEKTRTLFSGDAIYDGPLIDDLPDSSVADYVTTMKRLHDAPADVVHGGHEESFGRERLVELAGRYLEANS